MNLIKGNPRHFVEVRPTADWTRCTSGCKNYACMGLCQAKLPAVGRRGSVTA
jgi:hypothetical protein